jgi:hypothetical protein
VTPPRRYFFVHLQKTAGTALFRRLRHHFGIEAVYPRPDEQGTPATVLDVDLLRRRLGEEGDAIRCVTGHFPLATVDLLGGEWSTFTVLRDPVERVLSFLRHQREVDPRFADATLEEVYEAPVTQGGLVHDHMVKMLSLTAEEMTAGALTPVVVDEARVERAVANLEGRVDVVGLQERFEVFCSDLESAFGWDLGEPLFMNRTQPAEASDRLRARIATDNAHDLRLYALARARWEQLHPG